MSEITREHARKIADRHLNRHDKSIAVKYYNETIHLARLALRMWSERDDVRFRPGLGDNHHNANLCPYCTDERSEWKSRAEKAEAHVAELELINFDMDAGTNAARKHIAGLRSLVVARNKETCMLRNRVAELEAALRPVLDALQEPHGDVLPKKERDSVNPDYHLDITVTAAEAWKIKDALAHDEPATDGIQTVVIPDPENTTIEGIERR